MNRKRQMTYTEISGQDRNPFQRTDYLWQTTDAPATKTRWAQLTTAHITATAKTVTAQPLAIIAATVTATVLRQRGSPPAEIAPARILRRQPL